MVSWSPEPRAGFRRCDAPDCPNESLPERGLVLWPVLGPVLDRPLRLHFCEEHGDVGSLFERYLAHRAAEPAAVT